MESTNSNLENLRGDIVIIGGGGAGLTVAVAAAEAGAKNIIVLEKTDTPGGNTTLCHAVFAVESPAQERLGIKVTKDDIFREKMEYNHWKVDPRLVRAVIDKSGDMIGWLELKGLKFNNVIEFQRVGKYPRVFHMPFAGYVHGYGKLGKPLVDILTKKCQDFGIKLLCETPGKKILTDKMGRVSGVLATMKDKELKIITKSVIIAAGGFLANRELLNKYFPGTGDPEDVPAGMVSMDILPQMTGDGILLAEEVGADIIEDQMVLAIMGPHHYPSISLTAIVRRPHVMLVNKNGERYADESLSARDWFMGSNSLHKQPDKICYALMDSKIKQSIIQKREAFTGWEKDAGGNGAWVDELESDLQKDVATGLVKISDSWGGIAEWIGVKPEVLKVTVDQYNSFCDEGYDADFLKNKEYLIPLRTPPYYAVLGVQGYDTTLGGIRINHRMEVMNKQGRPITGLYAAGDNASGWDYGNYNFGHPGSSLCFALCSGFIAGENTAKYVLGKG